MYLRLLAPPLAGCSSDGSKRGLHLFLVVQLEAHCPKPFDASPLEFPPVFSSAPNPSITRCEKFVTMGLPFLPSYVQC
jgi:hypothetical protein